MLSTASLTGILLMAHCLPFRPNSLVKFEFHLTRNRDRKRDVLITIRSSQSLNIMHAHLSFPTSPRLISMRSDHVVRWLYRYQFISPFLPLTLSFSISEPEQRLSRNPSYKSNKDKAKEKETKSLLLRWRNDRVEKLAMLSYLENTFPIPAKWCLSRRRRLDFDRPIDHEEINNDVISEVNLPPN